MRTNQFTAPLVCGLAFVAFATFAQSAQAAQVPLSPTPTLSDLLVSGAYLEDTQGRVRFENFTFSAVPPSVPTTPEASNIFVSLFETQNSVKLLFQIASTSSVAAANALWDLHIEYDARIVDTNWGLVGHTVKLTGVATGTGFAIIADILEDGDGNNAGTPHPLAAGIGAIPQGGPTNAQATSWFDNPEFLITARKDLFVAAGTNGFVFLSDFSQEFHLTGNPEVPEPSSVALLALGGVALGLVAWRKRRRK